MNDDETENALMESDRTEVQGTAGFVSVDQAAVTNVLQGRYVSERHRGAVDIAGTKTTIGEKFYYIEKFEWQYDQPYGTKLLDVDVIAELLTRGPAVKGMADYHRYVRCGVQVMVNVNCTQYQQGCILVCLVPGDIGNASINGLTVFTHGIINCNINNTVTLEVPWVYPRPYYNIKYPRGPVWRLVVYVYNALQIASNANTTATVTCLGRLVNLEFHGMHPLSNTLGNVRLSTGNNVMNLSNSCGMENFVDMSLGPESFLRDPSCGGGREFKSFREIVKVPGLMMQFKYSVSHSIGKVVALWPVCPMFYDKITTIQSGSTQEITPIASVASQFLYWRGDLVYHLQAVGTRFHSGRLLICYVPGDEGEFYRNAGKNMSLSNATNCMSCIFDIGGVGSTCVFRVPWVCETEYAVNKAKGPDVSGANEGAGYQVDQVPAATGYVAVIVYSKLNCPVSVQNFVSMNVYASGVNMEFMAPVLTWPVASDRLVTNAGELEEAVGNPRKQDSDVGVEFGTAGEVQQQSKNFDDPPTESETQVPAGAISAIEDPKMMLEKPTTFPQLAHGRKRHTLDHMDVRTFMSRFHYYTSVSVTGTSEKSVNMPIIVKRPPSTSGDSKTKYFTGTLQWFFGMVSVYRGPMIVGVEIDGPPNLDVVIWFAPVGAATQPDWTARPNPNRNQHKASLGCVRVNTRFTGNVVFKLPWYVPTTGISPFTQDQKFGTLVFEVPGLDRSNTTVRFSAYISFDKDAEFYWPRGPQRHDLILDNDVSTFTMPDIEEIVDVERLPDRTERMHSAVYKSLRMSVGEARLKYAFQELKSQSEEDDEFGEYVMALAQENELFTQSGDSMYDDFTIVQKVDGKFVLRGFAFAHNIYYADNQPRATANLPGVRHGRFCVCPEDCQWLNLGMKADEKFCTDWAHTNFTKIKFNWLNFVNLEFDKAFGESEYKTLAAVFEMSNLKVFVPKQRNLLDKVVQDSLLYDEVKAASVNFVDLAQECNHAMKRINSALDNMSRGFVGVKKHMLMKVLGNLFKTGLRIYIGVKTSWNPGVMLALFAELSIDCVDCVVDAGSILRDLMNELVPDEELTSQSYSDWIRNIAGSLTIFKSLKGALDWLIEKMQNWFQTKFGIKKKILDSLLANEEKIEAMLDECDDFVLRPVEDHKQADEYKYGTELLKQVRSLQNVCNSDKSLHKFSVQLRDVGMAVSNKIKSLRGSVTNASLRHEPVVVYIHGPRGCGKSLASLALAVKICKQLGYDPTTNIYTRPPGSQFWDGYGNQLVCVMDDLGQCTDDEEWSHFCQLVSSCPCRLPMADLENKGRHFTSPIIIATSNQPDPTPRTVYNPEAVGRRLHLKVEVEVNSYYKIQVSGFYTLDVEKAKADGSLRDLSCIKMFLEGNAVSLDDLVSLILSQVNSRQKNFTEFIQLWSQGEEDMLSFLHKYNRTTMGRLAVFFRQVERHHVQILWSALGILSGALCVYGIFKAIKQSQKESTGAYTGTSRILKTVPLGKKEKLESQSVLEISVVIQNNLCRFGVSEDGDAVKWRLNCLGLKEDWVILPSHGFKFLCDTPKYIMILKKGVCYSCPLDKCTIIEVGDSYRDVCLVKIPGLPKFKNIVGHFISRKDLELCHDQVATLCTIQNGIYHMVGEGRVELLERCTYTHREEDKTHQVTISGAWRGSGDTTRGSCGGALVSSVNKLNCPIIGVHTAAGGGTLIATLVTREDLDAIDSSVSMGKIVGVFESQSFIPVGMGTEFRRSALYDVAPLPVRRLPSAMPFSRQSEVDVLSQFVDKFRGPSVGIPQGYEECVVAQLEILQKHTGVCDVRILSESEAILGYDHLDGINMKSGCGIPYVLKHLTKRDMLQNGQIVNQLLSDNLHVTLACMEKGFAGPCTFQACAKDELRPIEKVISGKTRFILSSPLHFTLAVRMVWGAAVSRLVENVGWRTNSAVGIDVDDDSHPLMMEAVRFGDVFLDLDFANFDASTSPFMLWGAVNILNCLSNCSESVALSVYQTICAARVQLGCLDFLIQGCIPSGTPFTSNLNTIINSVNLRFVLSKVLKVHPLMVEQYFKFICYGDDAMIVVRRGFEVSQGMLNQISNEFAELGMSVTSSAKGPLRLVSVGEVTFLKRNFRLDEVGLVHPLINSDTIFGLVQWTRKRAKFKDNLDDAVWFAYHYGPEFYNEFANDLSGWCRMVGLDYNPPPYDYWDWRFRSLPHVRNMS
nr:MAG: Genome polyprotein [Sphenilena virus]